MKLSFAISLPETGFNSNWVAKLRLMHELGYDGVELGIRNPEKINISYLEKILNRYRLELSAIGTGLMFIDDGLSISSINKGLRIRAINRIKKHIDIAKIFNAQVIIGLVRGKKADLTDDASLYYRNLTNSFKQIGDDANNNNVTITVEPINRYETDFLHCAKEVIDFIKILKCKNLKLLLDTFHMNIEEQNFSEPIRRAKRYLSHFHLADNNRKCPGQGHIDFKQIIDTLKEIAYAKYLSAEVLPLPNFKDCAQKYLDNIKMYL